MQFQSKGDAVHYVGLPPGVTPDGQRQTVDEINKHNGLLADRTLDPEVRTRIAQYELAFKMHTSVPDLSDFRKESKEYARPLRHQTAR